MNINKLTIRGISIELLAAIKARAAQAKRSANAEILLGLEFLFLGSKSENFSPQFSQADKAIPDPNINTSLTPPAPSIIFRSESVTSPLSLENGSVTRELASAGEAPSPLNFESSSKTRGLASASELSRESHYQTRDSSKSIREDVSTQLEIDTSSTSQSKRRSKKSKPTPAIDISIDDIKPDTKSPPLDVCKARYQNRDWSAYHETTFTACISLINDKWLIHTGEGYPSSDWNAETAILKRWVKECERGHLSRALILERWHDILEFITSLDKSQKEYWPFNDGLSSCTIKNIKSHYNKIQPALAERRRVPTKSSPGNGRPEGMYFVEHEDPDRGMRHILEENERKRKNFIAQIEWERSVGKRK